MASEPKVAGKNVAVVADGESSTAGGSGSPDRVLPLDVLEHLVPECTDMDLTECARDTVNRCVIEATGRLALAAADESARGNRGVISAEDMTRAIEGLTEKDTVLGTVLLEMTARQKEVRRAAALLRRLEKKAREEAAAEEEGTSGGRASASAAARQE